MRPFTRYSRKKKDFFLQHSDYVSTKHRPDGSVSLIPKKHHKLENTKIVDTINSFESRKRVAIYK